MSQNIQEVKPKMSLKKKIIYSGIAILVVSSLINGGLEKIKEKELADKGGFQSVSEYRSAKDKNIDNKADYNVFLNKKMEENEAAAKAAGFIGVDEYKKALAVKMPTKVLYDKYLAQQAELKIQEEKRKAEEAEQKRLAAVDAKRKSEETKVAGGSVAQAPTKGVDAPKTLTAYISEVRRLTSDYTSIQGLRSDTREILERSNTFMDRYKSFASDAASKPISGCVKNLTTASANEVSGRIWQDSGDSASHLYLSFQAPSSLGKVFSDDQVCIEGQVSKFECRSRYGVSFSGNPTLGEIMGTYMQTLVAPDQAFNARQTWRTEDAERRRSASARKSTPPTPASIYVLNLMCDIKVDATSASIKR